MTYCTFKKGDLVLPLKNCRIYDEGYNFVVDHGPECEPVMWLGAKWGNEEYQLLHQGKIFLYRMGWGETPHGHFKLWEGPND